MPIHPSACKRIADVQRRKDHVDDPANCLAAKTRARRPLNDLNLLHHADGQSVQRIRRSQSPEQGDAVQKNQGIHPFHAVELNAVRAAHPACHAFANPGGEIQRLQQVLGVGRSQ